MKILKNISLKNFTTFKVGGRADYFTVAKNENDIKKAVKFSKEKGLPFVVIGNGSNILINDSGFRGLVVKNELKYHKIEGDKIICGSGLMLPQLISAAHKNNLSGLWFLWGIPATVGGAIYQNAGTKSKWISDILETVKVLDKKREIKILKTRKSAFGYRTSPFKKKEQIIIEAVFNLHKESAEKEDRKIKEIKNKRLAQPKGFSAGSVFKNPGKKSAGLLIEKCGLKGKKIGDAKISKIHANFIINKGGAKSSDIISLIKKAEKEVKNKFGVHLKREVLILGNKGWE